MSGHYRDFMLGVEPLTQGSEALFLAQVQVITWASMYIEATTNMVAELLLRNIDMRNPSLGETLWRLGDRADIIQKLSALASLFEPDQSRADTHIKSTGRLFKIRNRLVHYKEASTESDPELLQARPMPSEKTFVDLLHELMNASPDPDIVHAVRSMPLNQRRQEAVAVGDWLTTLSRVRL